MKGRLARQKAIHELIKTRKIKSQETLLNWLQNEGFAVTQATLSRDLKALKVGKISDGHGAYVYFLPGDEERRKVERAYILDFLKGYISIEWSGNVVLVKTHSGHSDPVSVALDSFELEQVLGTVAGKDNTVAVFLKEGVRGEDFFKRMTEIIPEISEGEKNAIR